MAENSKSSNQILEPGFLRKLEALAIVAKKVQLGLSRGDRKSKRKGNSPEFADYRDYVQGDDLRFIDWNIFGRLDSLYLKLFMEQENLTVSLLIDSSQSMNYGTPSKLSFACQLAAAIGYIALVGYEKVIVETLSVDKEFSHSIRLGSGKASAGRLFSFLESTVASGETNLENSCKSFAMRNKEKGVVILLSDFFDPSGYEEGLKKLVSTGSDIYAIQILAPEEIDPQVSGDLKLLDSETNSYTEISTSRDLLKRYKKNKDDFCDAIRKFCLARGLNYNLAPSDTPIEKITLEVLRKGGLFK